MRYKLVSKISETNIFGEKNMLSEETEDPTTFKKRKKKTIPGVTGLCLDRRFLHNKPTLLNMQLYNEAIKKTALPPSSLNDQ